MAGKIELTCLPQGTMTECIRAGGAGIAAFYTPVGFGTELTKGKEVRRFSERDYLLEEAINGDLAVVAAYAAARNGNLALVNPEGSAAPVLPTPANPAFTGGRTVQAERIE